MNSSFGWSLDDRVQMFWLFHAAEWFVDFLR